MASLTEEHDYTLCRCALPELQGFVELLEARHDVRILREPALCLTMIRAEDSLEGQEFFLGEALTTECEVVVDGVSGHGLVLGEEPVRAYCIAVVEALLRAGGPDASAIETFLAAQADAVAAAEKAECALILGSQVDFKLMEQD